MLYEWKKDFGSLLGEKHLLGKPVHFYVKNTANNADTWGFIQQFFQNLYRTANSIETRQHKFSDIGNSTFRQEEYSTAEFWKISQLKLIQDKFNDTGIFL